MSSTNKEKVEALRFARKRIEEGSDYYICYALDEVSSRLRSASVELRIEIMRRLGNSTTVGQWLCSNVPDAYKFCSSWSERRWSTQCRLYRLRWIDALIAEYSSA